MEFVAVVLVGRWCTDDSRVVAVWEYDSREAYEEIQAFVDADPDAQRAKEVRTTRPPLFATVKQVFMTSTLTPSSSSRGDDNG
jgi:hypothetical protein